MRKEEFRGPEFTYRVEKIEKIIDGDTVDLIIDLGFDVCIKQRIRLAGINTPELRHGTAESKQKAVLSVNRLTDLLDTGEIYVCTVKDRTDKYGRYLGYLYIIKQNIEFEVNQILLDEGLAERY